MRPARAAVRAALLLAAAALACGCGKKHATLLYVTVNANEGVTSSNVLDVLFSQDGEDLSRRFDRPDGSALSFPTTFVIRADGRSGAATVSATASDSSGKQTASGSVSSTLSPSEEVYADLYLEPTDFQVNSTTDGNQSFTQDASGRQVASSNDGSFVVVWEGPCPTGATSCAVWYRCFDKVGQPTTSDARVAAGTTGLYSRPAVAMLEKGGFVVVYTKKDGSDGTNDTYGVYSQAFTAAGVRSGAEQEVSGAQSSYASNPASIKALSSGYAVAWIDSDTSNNRYLSFRFLNAAGQIPASGAATSVTSWNAGIPSVALGVTSKVIYVVWRQAGTLLAKIYDTSGNNKGSVTVTSSTGLVADFDVEPLSVGVIVLWTDQKVTTGQDKSGSCIKAQRFDNQGNALDRDAWTLNTTVAGDQNKPAGASRPADGSLLLTWTTQPDSSTVDIRGRRLHSSGLPIGDDFLINTTTVGVQQLSSVAPRLHDAFVVVFSDASKSGPDTSGSGIRARLVYPDYDVEDGLIGALCQTPTAAECAEGLSCLPAMGRCLELCPTSSYCQNGGKCNTLAGTTKTEICTFL